jgi:hypothetical protein
MRNKAPVAQHQIFLYHNTMSGSSATIRDYTKSKKSQNPSVDKVYRDTRKEIEKEERAKAKRALQQQSGADAEGTQPKKKRSVSQIVKINDRY